MAPGSVVSTCTGKDGRGKRMYQIIPLGPSVVVHRSIHDLKYLRMENGDLLGTYHKQPTAQALATHVVALPWRGPEDLTCSHNRSIFLMQSIKNQVVPRVSAFINVPKLCQSCQARSRKVS